MNARSAITTAKVAFNTLPNYYAKNMGCRFSQAATIGRGLETYIPRRRNFATIFCIAVNVETSLDYIELFFRFMSVKLMAELASPCIEELNGGFREHGIGYPFSNGQIIAILEAKRDRSDICQADISQACSYGSLIRPIPPLTIITNGKCWRFFKTIEDSEITSSEVVAESAYRPTVELERYHKEVKNFLGYSKHNLHQFSRWQVKTNIATLLGSQEDISGALLGLALSGELTLGSDARDALLKPTEKLWGTASAILWFCS